VYCLTAEVKDVKEAIETALEQLEDCEDEDWSVHFKPLYSYL
jgi:hypothetical protein